MSKEAQRTKRKKNSSDRLQLMESNLRAGFSKGIRNFTDEYMNAIESMKPKKYQDQPGERPMATERIPEKNEPLTKQSIGAGGYLMGQKAPDFSVLTRHFGSCRRPAAVQTPMRENSNRWGGRSWRLCACERVHWSSQRRRRAKTARRVQESWRPK